MAAPIVMVSSYPPRLCGIATFCEEAREFIQKANPNRDVLVISHTDGAGDGVFPLIDTKQRTWWVRVADKTRELQPHAVHIQHEYGLYEHIDSRGHGDSNQGLLDLLDALHDIPVVIEPHTVHGRLMEYEAEFLFGMCERAEVVMFKCHYQKWRLDWNFSRRGWETPRNIMIVPHGARPDKRWGLHEIPRIRRELGLDGYDLAEHLVGLIGWIQSNKRWDILTSMWEELAREIHEETGQDWDLLAAGTMRDPQHADDYRKYKEEVRILEKKGLAHYYEFVPRGDVYYQMMAVCDFIVLPSVDETQSGTLARIIALNKPFITTAPMEGLTTQTLQSNGGLLFTTKEMLRERTLALACDEELRMKLGSNLKEYLDKVVSWEVIARRYNEAYDLARKAAESGRKPDFPPEF